MTLRGAARFIDRVGFALLMPHRGLPLPTLWEAIRGRPGGHPFRPWTRDSDLLWAWKDALPAGRLAYYGSLWAGRPGFVSLRLLPCLLRLWGTPLGPEGFRTAYREGRLSFDAHRLAEALLAAGPLNTYRLRRRTGTGPAAFGRSLKELQRTLLVAKCGTDGRDTTWDAEVVDLSARVFPAAHAEARGLSPVVARDEAVGALAAAAPALSPRAAARLLRTGAAAPHS